MITFYRKYQSDFWWLTADELKKFNYIHVCYQEPYSDEPRSNRTPTSVCRYFSLDNNNNLSSEIKYYKLSYLDSWKKRFNNTNVFRSIYLFSYPCQENKDSICGPIILDIDREKPSDKGYAYDLQKALEDTRHILKICPNKLEESDFRVFFTGHKGFNIEINPSAFGINPLEYDKSQFMDIRKSTNNKLGSSFFDNWHSEIRLHGSINKWVANDGRQMNRMKFELNLIELNTMTIYEILNKSEKLAYEYLSSIK